MAEMSEKKRKSLKASQMEMEAKGKLSASEKAKIDRKADRVLSKGKKK